MLMGEALSDTGARVPDHDPSLDLTPDQFVRKLEPYERVLVDLKEILYEGSWDRIVVDLRNRLDNKPYVYRLSHAIERDLKAIERLKAYEARHQVNLQKLIKERQ